MLKCLECDEPVHWVHHKLFHEVESECRDPRIGFPEKAGFHNNNMAFYIESDHVYGAVVAGFTHEEIHIRVRLTADTMNFLFELDGAAVSVRANLGMRQDLYGDSDRLQYFSAKVKGYRTVVDNGGSWYMDIVLEDWDR